MYVSAIIPAYNEENTIAGVLEVLKYINNIDEIIVVSDGSKDKTVFIAEQYKSTVINLPQNMGKGAAIKSGLSNCKGDIVLLLDADLIGLDKSHVNNLLTPVLNDEAEMTIGIFTNGRFSTDMAQKIAPYLSGQRVVKKYILDEMLNLEISGYGIEIALTIHARKEKFRVKEVELENITHIMKEEKFGLIQGFAKRIKMYWEIYRGIRISKG